MTDDEFPVVEALALTKGVSSLAQMQLDSLRFVISLRSNRYDEADEALAKALDNYTLSHRSTEQLIARLSQQAAALRRTARSDQEKDMEETNLRKWMNQLNEANPRQANARQANARQANGIQARDPAPPPVTSAETPADIDAIRQSLENRLAHLHGDVDALGRKFDENFRWVVGILVVAVILMIGVTAAGVVYLADQLAG